MSLRNWIATLLPKFIVHELQLRRNQIKLVAAPRQPCGTDNLARISESQLSGFFGSEVVNADWRTVDSLLDQFNIPDMTGGVNSGDRRALYYLARALDSASVLEIGTHIGSSTIHLAKAIGRNTDSDDRQPNLTSVDIADVNDPQKRPWIQHQATHSPCEMIESLGCKGFVQFQTCPSLEYLKNCDRHFDLIFLDGDHSAMMTYLEIPVALHRLNPGGVLLLHDYFPGLKPLWSDGSLIHGPFLAVDRLIREGNPLEVLPLGNLPWPTKLGSRKTSLALLTLKAE